MPGAQQPDDSPKPSRILYIDNLRVLLTCLVVLHHLAITYGAPGDWYYRDTQGNQVAYFALLPLVAFNQAFFMGFFFLIAGYFTAASLARKRAAPFLRERSLRLGVPLLLYAMVLNPLLVATIQANTGQSQETWITCLLTHYLSWIGPGPMWFVLNLLLLTLVFVGLRRLRPARPNASAASGPGTGATLALAVALGLTSFLVRIRYPIGFWIPGLSLMPSYAPQYLVFFALGILAWEFGWRGELSGRLVRFWSWAVPIVSLTAWGSLGAIKHKDPLGVMGGLRWESFVYSLWDEAFAVGFVILLLDWFRRRFDRQGPLLSAAAADSYAVYTFHPLVLVALALALRSLPLHPLAKFALLAPISLAACFATAHLIRRLPVARRIF
jgi:glucan biosynthesis protein C